MNKEALILQQIAELGELYIEKSLEYPGYYCVGIKGLLPYLAVSFTEENLFNALVSLTAQKRIKENAFNGI